MLYTLLDSVHVDSFVTTFCSCCRFIWWHGNILLLLYYLATRPGCNVAWTLDIGQWCNLLLHFASCGLFMAWHHLIRYIDKRTVWRPVATRSWRVGLSPTCVLVGVLFCKFGQSRPIFGICTSSSTPTNFLQCILILRRKHVEGREPRQRTRRW